MPAQANTKRCSSPFHSGPRELPLEAFHRASKEKDGRKSRCKVCVATEYRENQRIRDQQRIRSQRWYEKNQEAFGAQLAQRYRDDSEYREKKKQASRDWRRDNPERFRQQVADWEARNPERVAQNRKNARRRRREYHRVQLILYRARKKAAGGNVTVEKIRARWNYFNERCWMCGEEADAMDHVKPVVAGGGSWASNLRPACKSCNSRKSGKWPFPVSCAS